MIYGGDPFTGMDSSVKDNGGSLTPATAAENVDSGDRTALVGVTGGDDLGTLGELGYKGV